MAADREMETAVLRHEQRLATLERDHGEVRRSMEQILVEQRRLSTLLEDQRELAQKSSEALATLLVLTERQTNMREALERSFTANATTKTQVDALRDKVTELQRLIPEHLAARLGELEKAAPIADTVRRWVFAAVLAAAAAAATLGWTRLVETPPPSYYNSQPK